MSEKQFNVLKISLSKEERLKYIQTHMSNASNSLKRIERELAKMRDMLIELYK
jgi:hypothetical protein